MVSIICLLLLARISRTSLMYICKALLQRPLKIHSRDMSLKYTHLCKVRRTLMSLSSIVQLCTNAPKTDFVVFYD